MIRTKLFLACALAFVVSATTTTPASAQEPVNQLTYFTFSAPFELPGGKVLPAGKYVFKIADSASNRHVVQIMSEDQQTMHATLMAIPAQRLEPSDEPEVRFMEAAADAAPAIRTWWYPGRTIGHEFIYPKDHAMRLASRQSEGVLTVAGDATGDDAMKTGELTRLGRDGQETAVNAEANTERMAENAMPESQTGEPQQSAEAQTSPETSASATGTPATTAEQPAQSEQTAQSTPETSAQPTAAERETAAADDTMTRSELPRTATALPLIALLGIGSLLGAGLLRLRR